MKLIIILISLSVLLLFTSCDNNVHQVKVVKFNSGQVIDKSKQIYYYKVLDLGQNVYVEEYSERYRNKPFTDTINYIYTGIDKFNNYYLILPSGSLYKGFPETKINPLNDPITITMAHNSFFLYYEIEKRGKTYTDELMEQIGIFLR
jgi:hypothetical protein